MRSSRWQPTLLIRTSGGAPVILEVLSTVLASAAAVHLRFITWRQATLSILVSMVPHSAENKP